jgi:hypothetical protein
MCKTVEIEVSPETVASLKLLAGVKLQKVIDDECSFAILTECESDDIDELALAIGRSVLNSLIASSIELGMESEGN